MARTPKQKPPKDHLNLKYSEEELAEQIVKIQQREPLYTDANICMQLGVANDYILERAKNSQIISEARKKAQAIRETAWVARGIDGMVNPTFNGTVYIWMTRNILKWRNEDKLTEHSKIEHSIDPKQVEYWEKELERVRKLTS